MFRTIPIAIILSLLAALNPFYYSYSSSQYYFVDVSAIEIDQSGGQRYLSNAKISLVDVHSNKEIKAYKITPECYSYTIDREFNGTEYDIQVKHPDSRQIYNKEISLDKIDKYAWKIVYVQKDK
jgi:hypothetical protein